MKYVDEYRDEEAALAYAEALGRLVTRPWTIMEICGGQTHAIMKFGIDQLLPEQVELVHGPGCPVCVTPVELIDRAIAIAGQPGVILTSFGDMLRVPGSDKDLLGAKSEGGDVRIVYSPLDAVTLAQNNPDRQVVFFGVGFETTAPVNAMSVHHAKKLGLKNFSLLSSHVLVPPAMHALLGAPDNVVQGFLAAGHVCTIMGYHQYEAIAEQYRVPIVATGFEPLDILQGLHMVLRALEEGRVGVDNQYRRAVRREGNTHAQQIINEVFEVCDRQWRGIGNIPQSGLRLSSSYREYDAEERFGLQDLKATECERCIAGQILRGLMKPPECPEFGKGCTPERPLGAPMVSAEGACSAYYSFARNNLPSREAS